MIVLTIIHFKVQWLSLGFKIEFSKSNHFCNVEHSEIQHCWKAFFNVRRILYDKSSFLSHKALSFFFSGHHHQKRIVTHFVTYFPISLCKGHINLNSLINAIVDFSFLEIFTLQTTTQSNEAYPSFISILVFREF